MYMNISIEATRNSKKRANYPPFIANVDSSISGTRHVLVAILCALLVAVFHDQWILFKFCMEMHLG